MATIRLHLRILDPPVSVSVDDQVTACKAVFSQAGVTIEVKSKETVQLSKQEETKFIMLNVHSGCSNAATTAEQRDLFALASDVDGHDVVIFFVNSTDPALDGCSQHPAGRPGAIVTAFCTQWALAHELGHVLGLEHVDSRSRVMFGKGTIGISANPPEFVQSEIGKIHADPLGLLH